MRNHFMDGFCKVIIHFIYAFFICLLILDIADIHTFVIRIRPNPSPKFCIIADLFSNNLMSTVQRFFGRRDFFFFVNIFFCVRLHLSICKLHQPLREWFKSFFFSNRCFCPSFLFVWTIQIFHLLHFHGLGDFCF